MIRPFILASMLMSTLLLASCGSSGPSEAQTAELNQVLQAAKIAIPRSIQPGTDPYASEVAETYVEQMQATGHSGKLPIKWFVDEPDGPWSVVLVADDEAHSIRIYGYGLDFETPILEQLVGLPQNAIPMEMIQPNAPQPDVDDLPGGPGGR